MSANAPLRLVNAVIEPVLAGISHDFEKGSVTVIATGTDSNCALLLDVFLGIQTAGKERVLLLGEDTGSLSGHALRKLRSRIGVSLRNGGLISNLKVIENVALPLLYHCAESAGAISEKAFRALERAGYDGDPFLPPGRLSGAQRVTVSMARVLASDPELVLYDRLGDGLPKIARKKLIDLALDFHQERPDRTTIFLFPHPGTTFSDMPVTVFNLS